MLSRLAAQLHEIRLDLHGRWLRRQERAALGRLGEEVAAGPPGDHAAASRAVAKIDGVTRQLADLASEVTASLAADRSDLRWVAPWMQPVVVARGLCARAVLRHRAAALRRTLRPHYEVLGRLAVENGTGGTRGAVVDAREELQRLGAERERRLASFGATAHPAWTRTTAAEATRLGRAILGQLRSALFPRLPALAGMLVGWWIANTYTDSHVRSMLRTVGIGSGGTRVVSGSTYKAMNFWLPLLAAAVCAYLGERLAGYYRHRHRRQPVRNFSHVAGFAECQSAGADGSPDRPFNRRENVG